ncbi:RNA polymerase sigma factor [Haliscomenobacter hydrossis]|uniref:RNA polymerase, sigma-24 subunit, ECF subfamily n=1 Tax=Haliscomenobacter hydrossis (strain ATCC 27775 / DSM 1100 / LMG 10767 / O) TaxID=760192 RepID=F4L0T9_HALH1|nr:sigma-70 family RNA polymerase sigma factor [Haliscomenobacter hydrossis]AEE50543.1 RNA polymerase, sigma-24 subunit, ECF subfamily [Haliscomenobacter hydrossis DSM 1100]
MHLQDDIDLINQLKAGDEKAYEVLYDRYSAMLYGVMCRIVNDHQEVEHLLQDCFVKIWQNIGQFDASKGRLATWLINIARNLAIDFTRSKYFSQKLKNQPIENFVYGLGKDNSSITADDTIGLVQLVEKLPATSRQIIEWMYFEGYTQQEIADNFNIPLGTVKSRARLALNTLRTFFSHHFNLS